MTTGSTPSEARRCSTSVVFDWVRTENLASDDAAGEQGVKGQRKKPQKEEREREREIKKRCEMEMTSIETTV